jgi:hypothetical protein
MDRRVADGVASPRRRRRICLRSCRSYSSILVIHRLIATRADLGTSLTDLRALREKQGVAALLRRDGASRGMPLDAFRPLGTVRLSFCTEDARVTIYKPCGRPRLPYGGA